jgi:UDP-N-acetylmuramoylalanine--D-glutamate ligase
MARESAPARPPLPAGPYLVVGLARSGQAVARLLARRGEEVIGSDLGSPEGAEELEESGVRVSLDTGGVELLDRARCLVKSPGVPADAPVVAAARERGTEVIGELELSWRLLPNRFVGVTGTNGKTTVTELLGHLWRTAAQPVAVAGNVGTPLAALVDEIPAETTVVCECSSFQLEDAHAFAPECGVFLNLAPDHLDRHPTTDDYLRAKLRIFANQNEDDVAIYNAGELNAAQLPGRARRIAFCEGDTGYGPPGRGRGRFACDATLSGGSIWWGEERLIESGELRLLGEHNAENATGAAAAALAMGLGRRSVRDGLASFPGVPHRLERVAELAGVAYVNDSKATNVVATLAALRSFEGGVRVILGGRPKGESFVPLLAEVPERCVACYLIGEAAAQLARDLGPAEARGVDLRRCRDLADAVRAAAADSRSGEIVLLAPACASFDSYRDFERRGEHFRALVDELRTR